MVRLRVDLDRDQDQSWGKLIFVWTGLSSQNNAKSDSTCTVNFACAKAKHLRGCMSQTCSHITRGGLSMYCICNVNDKGEMIYCWETLELVIYCWATEVPKYAKIESDRLDKEMRKDYVSVTWFRCASNSVFCDTPRSLCSAEYWF